MSSSNGATFSPSSMSHSNESTDDEQSFLMGSTLGDSTEDNQSILQDASDDEPRLKRKVPFRGFTNGSQEDIELLSAIEQYAPYDAQYGQKKEAWGNIFTYLKSLDEDRVKSGFAPRYTTLSEGACKKRWEVHQALVRQYEATLKTTTGIAPLPSAHMERMRRVVDMANAFKERADDMKLQRSKKKEEYQKRHAMAEEMRKLATQRFGKRSYVMLEHLDTQTNTTTSSSQSESRMSRDGSIPTFNVSSESSANADAHGAVHSSSSSRSNALIDMELQRLQSDSDAIVT
ncbi:hypothetical protein FBU30_001210 [Linnemannia zychae]|nr:hypothetical protein FBU30_001210 [Linnemannia zychae]